MDIEKLIEQLRTESLYADKASLEIMDLCMDAAQTLESLQSELEKVKAERDAAVNDLQRINSCKVCKHCEPLKTLIPEICRKCSHGNQWEWRGRKED